MSCLIELVRLRQFLLIHFVHFINYIYIHAFLQLGNFCEANQTHTMVLAEEYGRKSSFLRLLKVNKDISYYDATHTHARS